MSARSLARLLIVTAIAVAAAVLSLWSSRDDAGSATRGTPFLPGLIAQADSITRIVVDTGDGRTELRRRDDAFVDSSGYPADAQVIRALLAAMATLIIEEPRTSDPERYPELDLAAPEAEQGAGILVEVFAGDRPLARLVVGKRDSSVGGTSGGVFARRLDAPPSFLLRGALNLPIERAEWFDATLLTVPRQQVQSVTTSAAVTSSTTAKAVRFESAKPGDPLMLVDLPVERKPDQPRATRLAGLLDPLRFTDVRVARPDAAATTTIKFATRDGAEITLERLAGDDGADQWVRLTAHAITEPGRALVDRLGPKANGREFRLGAAAMELLEPEVDRWLLPPGSPS